MASLGSFRALAVALAAVTFLALREEIDLPQVDQLFRDAVFWLVLIGLLGSRCTKSRCMPDCRCLRCWAAPSCCSSA